MRQEASLHRLNGTTKVSIQMTELQRTSPEQQGVASAAILQFVEALERQIHEVHSFMVLRHGAVIAEGWWSPYASEYTHLLFSVSKSFTSTAVGLAIAEGHFTLDDAIISFFPEETPTEISELLAAMTVRHLLSMSTGHDVDTWSYMVEHPDGNWVKEFLNVPVVHPPGTHFLYNTGASYVLSAIVQKTTDMTLLDYLKPRLFEPLGIENATWQASPVGITAGGIGLSLKTEDVARFGQLYLQEGVWQGRPVLSTEWVKAATTSQVTKSSGMHTDWMQGYGYQFWRSRHGAYRADGVFGQFCIVMPEQDAVLAITSGVDIFDMQQPLELVWDILLPAMHAAPLPDNPVPYNLLAEKLASLAMPFPQGEPTSLIGSKVSGRVYSVDANSLSIQTITFDFAPSSCMVRMQTSAQDELFPCGYGAWLRGETTLFKQFLLFDRTPIAVSSAWTAEHTFRMVVHLYETPFFYTFDCHFIGDDLMVEIKVNVSMESMTPILLTAQAV
jgi:CubicO group peptidase (beta-lactamase class C family)